MTILINRSTRVLIQGITGSVGSFQTRIMLDYGTKIVAGVTPGKGTQMVHGVPVYDFAAEAVAAQGPIDAAFCFVPGRFARDAAMEVIEAGIKFLVVTAEGIPNQDMIHVIHYARQKGARVLGPDTAGVISPGKSKLGVHPNRMFCEGSVGVLSKSGALSYEVCKNLTEAGIGQTTVVGIGGGPHWGMTQLEILEMFQQDDETRAVVLFAEVGGCMEHDSADFIRRSMTKPVIAMIVGRSAPRGVQMGHAGAIIEGDEGTAASKLELLRSAGAYTATRPAEIVEIIKGLGIESGV
jgi:succinyl-CoA synthetase alpha subunit